MIRHRGWPDDSNGSPDQTRAGTTKYPAWVRACAPCFNVLHLALAHASSRCSADSGSGTSHAPGFRRSQGVAIDVRKIRLGWDTWKLEAFAAASFRSGLTR